MEEVWVSKDHLKMMVNAFVMSHLDYVTVYTAVAYPSGKYIHVSCSEFTTVPHA